MENLACQTCGPKPLGDDYYLRENGAIVQATCVHCKQQIADLPKTPLLEMKIRFNTQYYGKRVCDIEDAGWIESVLDTINWIDERIKKALRMQLERLTFKSDFSHAEERM